MTNRIALTTCFILTLGAGAAPAARAAAPLRMPSAAAVDVEDRADELYDDGREAIEEGRYERAVDRFTQLAALNTSRTDAALYWKAYSQAKLGRRADALGTLADLQRRFKDSRWIRDAKALEVEVRQASGQTVSPDTQSDEEIKLMALRALMQNDAERALPILQQLLTGAASPKVKDRALFVLSQSSLPRAHELITGIAKGTGNPDLQLLAIRYLGIMGGSDTRQTLGDVYRTSSDGAVKRAIIRSFMIAGDRDRLLSLARTETAPDLRGEAVQQLGVMHASAELAQMYQTESSIEIKKRILQAMFIGGDATKLMDLAKTERDAQLRRSAIRNLGLMPAPQTGETLKAIYQSDTDSAVREEIVNALFLQNNGHALVELARAEKDPKMKAAIVSKMSVMSKSKEVSDYLMELLK